MTLEMSHIDFCVTLDHFFPQKLVNVHEECLSGMGNNRKTIYRKNIFEFVITKTIMLQMKSCIAAWTAFDILAR